MPPKKRDKENEAAKNIKMENNTNADHEQFLMAFEKPTQIYRYLRTRNMVRPIFLYRNMTYMKHRMSRSHKSRKEFKVDSMLQAVTSKSGPFPLNRYLTLTFLGFYSNTAFALGVEEPVKVETLLVKICHKKRKDSACPLMSVSLGTSYIPLNPSEACPPLKAPTVCIPTESFKLSTGTMVKSYHLILKCSTSSSNVEYPTIKDESDQIIKKRRTGKPDDSEPVHYGTNLILYDRNNRCHLKEGDYEFTLDKFDEEVAHKLLAQQASLTSWEDFGFDSEFQARHKPSFKKITSGPSLKLRLQWTREQVTALVDRPVPVEAIEYSVTESTTGTRPASKYGDLTVVYQFLYNNNTKQQTGASSDMHCPWCSINCTKLYSLLKHLKLCHPRFNFGYAAVTGGVRINISVNEGYDGSNWTTTGGLTRGIGPTRRQPLSHVIVCRPKRTHNLSEFINTDDTEVPRPYITGHNRLYHHTSTCLPIYPKEMDIDSEDETDPRWLQKKTMMMIDEFTDVNEGEKELMKMWNLHVMKHGFVGDVQVQLACEMFLEERGRELLVKNLYRNFVLHMCNLFDFGLISPLSHFKIMQHVQEIIETDKKVNKILQDCWTTQREHWNPIEQAPKFENGAPTGQPGEAGGVCRSKLTDEKGKRRRGRRLAGPKPELRSAVPDLKDSSNKKSAP